MTMSRDNPYRSMIARQAALLQEGKALPLGGIPACDRPVPDKAAGKALIFSPHPDDECIIGGLALRLQRECGMQVINIAVTQGRHPERQAARLAELQNACAFIGFDLLQTAENGLHDIDLTTRERHPEAWSAAVAVIADILDAQKPDVIFLPHDSDWHPAHIGTHHLVLDALASLPATFACTVVETEFWAAMATPNLMIESSPDDVADLAAALSFHVGEVARNPYHLRLPAWMIDNVRRGSELVQGKGEAAPDMTFATLYRLGRWANGRLQEVLSKGQVLNADEDVAGLLT
ncbi:MAG: PIG-L deacetylase family protein [Geminicoccaceae bacterium]